MSAAVACVIFCPAAYATTHSALDPPTTSTDIATIESRLARLQSHSNTQTEDTTFATYGELEGGLDDSTPVARIGSDTVPIGLNMTKDGHMTNSPDELKTIMTTSFVDEPSLTNMGDVGTLADNRKIDPNLHLPNHVATTQSVLDEAQEEDRINLKPNIIKRLYARLFNEVAQISPRLSSIVYLAKPKADTQLGTPPSVRLDAKDTTLAIAIDEGLWEYEANLGESVLYDKDTMALIQADDDIEPFKNITAAIDSITADSIPSFSAGIPRLKEVVQSAAQAVGYYDMAFTLRHEGGGKIGVIITRLGEPVLTKTSLVDVRGGGQGLPEFEQITKQGDELIDEPFHHGDYEKLKTAINTISADKGFFDGRWLDNSVGVILPDNVADVSLIYDTGDRYKFGEVIFFTRNPKTGQLTTKSNQLPVRADLLYKLVDFESGDGFNRQQVVQLSNDITGTRYFDTASVEMIFPESKQNPAVAQVSSDASTLGEQVEGEEEIDSIDFGGSEQLLERLERVIAKAERLHNSPNNRVLDEKRGNSTNLLGKISDAISSLVKAILPDETAENQALLGESEPLPILLGRKSPQEVYTDKKVPLYIFVSSERPKNAQIGLGWGSDTGMRATAKIDNNLINKDGYQAGIETAISRTDKQINAYLSRPLTHPLNDKLIANASYLEEEIKQQNTLTVSNRTAQAGLSRTVRYPSDWHRNYGIRYRLDRLDTNIASDRLQDLPVWFGTGRPIQQATLIGGSLSKTVQDDLIAPTRGYRQYYSVEVGSRQLISDANMVIARAGVGGVYSFGNNRYGENRAHQLVGRLDAGYLWANNFDRVPYKLRFFTGGDQSIRGYNHQSLSPVDDKGFLLGGQILAVGSLEYNYEVKEGIRVATFVDVGNAYDKHFKTDTKVGVGLGVRYASPIGTVRVDVAKGIERDKTPIKFHFLIGLPF